MHIPERLNWLRRHEAGRAWLGNLPCVVAGLAREWNLEVDAPFEGSNVSYVAPAMRGSEQVLVHQDLHGENVLAAQREPWLVIDPKPLAGEREFSLAPIIRSFELGHSKKDVTYRLERLSSELTLDRDRVRRWTIAQTIAWSFSSGYAAHHYETARWLLSAK